MQNRSSLATIGWLTTARSDILERVISELTYPHLWWGRCLALRLLRGTRLYSRNLIDSVGKGDCLNRYFRRTSAMVTRHLRQVDCGPSVVYPEVPCDGSRFQSQSKYSMARVLVSDYLSADHLWARHLRQVACGPSVGYAHSASRRLWVAHKGVGGYLHPVNRVVSAALDL